MSWTSPPPIGLSFTSNKPNRRNFPHGVVVENAAMRICVAQARLLRWSGGDDAIVDRHIVMARLERDAIADRAHHLVVVDVGVISVECCPGWARG